MELCALSASSPGLISSFSQYLGIVIKLHEHDEALRTDGTMKIGICHLIVLYSTTTP